MQAALFECRRTVKFFYVKEYTLEMAIEDGVPGAQVRLPVLQPVLAGCSQQILFLVGRARRTCWICG